MSRFLTLFTALLSVTVGTLAYGEEVSLRVISWNVESGDSDPEVIAERIAKLEGVDIWGLCEVPDAEAVELYEEAAEEGEEADFDTVFGTTGRGDRLAIIYNKSRLRKVNNYELHSINPGGRVRSPLVTHFKGKTTGQEFLFMVNHLYRGSAEGRHSQAKKLNEWARRQELPVIAVGDWNFDWDAKTGDNPAHRDKGYDYLTKDQVFAWLRPKALIKTQDSRYNSVLDFVFVAGSAYGWTAKSKIIVTPGDFPDDEDKSDHRPVEAIFTVDTEKVLETPAITKEGIMERIERLEQELEEIKELAEGLE